MIGMMLTSMLHAAAAIEIRIRWTLVVAGRRCRVVICVSVRWFVLLTIDGTTVTGRLGLHWCKIRHRVRVFAMRFTVAATLSVRLRRRWPSVRKENGNTVIHCTECQYRIILPGFVRIRCARISQTTFVVCLRHLFIHFRHLVLVLAQLISSTGKGFVVARRDDYLKHRYDDLLIIRIQLFRHRQHAESCSQKWKKRNRWK